MGDFDSVMREAVRGHPEAFHQYVGTWGSFTRQVLACIHESRPDLVVESHGGLAVVDVKGKASTLPLELIKLGAFEAPFSGWVAKLGPGEGAALSLLSRVRQTLRGVAPLEPPAKAGFPHWDIDPPAHQRFVRLVAFELIADKPAIRRIAEIFDLNHTKLGELFGVTRTAATDWLDKGNVPSDRQAKLVTILAIGELLLRKLRSGLVPGVARKQSEAYGGLSMLQMISADRHEELLELTRESFDWAATA